MKSLFHRRPRQTPILTPRANTGAWRRQIASTFANLPPAAAPIAATIGGGVAMLLVAALFIGGGGEDRVAATETTTVDAVAEGRAAPEETAPQPDQAAEVATTSTPAAVQPSATPQDSASADEESSFTDLATPDQQRTAAIPPALPGASQMAEPVVPVAETEDEILALEAIQRSEVEEDVGPPSDEWTSAIAQDATPTRLPATTTRYVNMRAEPGDDGEVLEVVPALANIEAEGNCDWCAVSYEGRQGYIYKTFISYE